MPGISRFLTNSGPLNGGNPQKVFGCFRPPKWRGTRKSQKMVDFTINIQLETLFPGRPGISQRGQGGQARGAREASWVRREGQPRVWGLPAQKGQPRRPAPGQGPVKALAGVGGPAKGASLEGSGGPGQGPARARVWSGRRGQAGNPSQGSHGSGGFQARKASQGIGGARRRQGGQARRANQGWRPPVKAIWRDTHSHNQIGGQAAQVREAGRGPGQEGAQGPGQGGRARPGQARRARPGRGARGRQGGPGPEGQTCSNCVPLPGRGPGQARGP